jgi:hypothetical protein
VSDALVTVALAVFALVVMAYTAHSWRLSRSAVATLRAKPAPTIDTARWLVAVDMLSRRDTPQASGLDWRLGGVYLLERLSMESTADLVPATDLLSAFVRHRAQLGGVELQPTVEVQTVLTVLARSTRDGIDLRRTALWGIDLTGGRLVGANFSGARLRGAQLADARLTGARFSDADLSDADLTGADLTGAVFARARLRGANLQGTKLRAADLRGADLRGAIFLDTDLRDANLTGARLGTTATVEHTPNTSRSSASVVQSTGEGRATSATFVTVPLVGTRATQS